MTKDDGKSKPTKNDDDIQVSIHSDQRRVTIKPTSERKKPKP